MNKYLIKVEIIVAKSLKIFRTRIIKAFTENEAKRLIELDINNNLLRDYAKEIKNWKIEKINNQEEPKNDK